jgi:hypothetical protein
MKPILCLLTLLSLLNMPSAAQAPKPAANTAVSNKETQIKRFFVVMGGASQGENLGKTALLGSPVGTPFTDSLKDGGVLVGLEVWGGAVVSGLQPIFETETGRVRGKKHGRCVGDSSVLEAKEGFAVVGLNANGASGFEVLFMRIHHSTLALDAAGSYKSEWVGAKYTRSTRVVPNQKPIIGVYGTISGGINGVGLLYYDRK